MVNNFQQARSLSNGYAKLWQTLFLLKDGAFPKFVIGPIHFPPMHKVTFCLLLVFALTITSFKATAQNPDDPLIEIFNTNHGKGGRTLTRIAVAYYNPDTQTVTLRYHASEDAVIYFVSPDNTLLDTEYVEEGEYEEIVFNVPSAPGTYTIVVRSESFTGEGRFSVE